MGSGSKSESKLNELARALLDVSPLVTRAIRAEMRAHRNAELSVPQFRVLGYVQRRRGVSLSELADHIGLGLPSMSTMIEGLVQRGLLDRKADRADRRRVVIELTRDGEETWAAALRATCESMVRRLRRLSAEKREELLLGLDALRLLFSEEKGADEKGA